MLLWKPEMMIIVMTMLASSQEEIPFGKNFD